MMTWSGPERKAWNLWKVHRSTCDITPAPHDEQAGSVGSSINSATMNPAVSGDSIKPTLIHTHALLTEAHDLHQRGALKLDAKSRKELLAKYSVEGKLGDSPFPEGVARELVPISFWEEAAVVAFSLFILGAFVWLPALIICTFILLPFYLATALWVTVFCIHRTLNFKCFPPAGKYSYLATAFVKYFSYRAAYEVAPDPNYPTLYAGGPHGLLPIGNFMQMLSNELTAGFDFHGLGASAALQAPVYGDLLKLLGLEDVSKSNFIYLLGTKKESVGLVPGGIAEMFAAFEEMGDAEVLVLQTRKGFIKIALQTGAQLVPCYLFGNTQIFHLVRSEFLCRLSRRFQIAITPFWGRWKLSIPYRQPVFGVMGRPILCPKTDEPSQEMIDLYHEMHVKELVRAFDITKERTDGKTRHLLLDKRCSDKASFTPNNPLALLW